MLSRRFFLGATVFAAGLLCGGARAGTVGPDAIPWPVEEGSAPKRANPDRARWLFWPDDSGAAELALSAEAVAQRVAVLPRFSGVWILESDFGDRLEVESIWGPLGTLRQDVSGTAAMSRTTQLIGAQTLWSAQDHRGNRMGTVAIFDSGCDTAHDDLGDPDTDNNDFPPDQAGDADDWVDATVSGHPIGVETRVVGWHDVSDDMPTARGPYDYERHGTALAGAAFGSGEIDDELSGVAPDGRFVVVKTYNFEGIWQHWASDFLLGVDWLLQHHRELRVRAALIATNWPLDLQISVAVQELLNAGIVVIAAAGNEASTLMGWPARVPDVLTVGATDATGRVAAYSNRGTSEDPRIDLVAPGGSLASAAAAIQTCDNEPNDTYRGRVGTSIAAAHVAGAVSLVTQAIEESGIEWRYERDQALWVQDILRITCVETEGAEVGAPEPPTLNRVGRDGVEGFGLLQVLAAVDLARRASWPGERSFIFLNPPQVGIPNWARRIPVFGRELLRFSLSLPPDADYDLLLYREADDGFGLVASSMNLQDGVPESIEIETPGPGHYAVVVRRVRGQGLATLQSERVVLGATNWPVQLASTVADPPQVFDLDGDGSREVIAVNNLPVDPRGHSFYILRANGSNYGAFPRTVFSASNRSGAVYTPAIADFGSGPIMVCGTAFGDVIAMDTLGQLQFDLSVSGGVPTTRAAIYGTGPSTRVVLGTENGVEFLDATGASVDSWSLAGGVSRDPVIGDLDGDGTDEIVLIEDGVAVHARELNGTPLSGWPVALAAGLSATDVVGLGSGTGAMDRVAWVERLDGGGARVQLREPSGASVAGFPVDFDTDQNAVAEPLGGICVSRLIPGGPSVILAPAFQIAPAGPISQSLHVFSMAGGQSRWETSVHAESAFVDGTFQLTRRFQSAPVVADVSGLSGAEVFWSYQVAWHELELTQLRRFGSIQAVRVANSVENERRLQLQLGDGRTNNPKLGLPPIIATDLTGDGFVELVVPRNEWLHLQPGRVGSNVSDYWTQVRNDARHSGCYRCLEETVVAVDEPPSAAKATLAVYPNPANPRAIAKLSVPHAGTARFWLYDLRGREVRRWSRFIADAGEFVETIDGTDDRGRTLASGVYEVVVRVGSTTLSAPLTILR